MTEALCGPSNALSSFQKHTQVDRTLQQDRLRGPSHSPAQGFRSFDPRAGSLDAEFAAFENAPTNPFQLEQPQWQHNTAQQFSAQPASNWASDFQNLRISNLPIPVSQFRTEAPLMRTTPGGWQQEFMRQRPGLSSVAQQKQSEITSQTPDQSYLPFLGGSTYMPHQSLQNKQSAFSGVQAQDPQFNEEDFEKAFQDAFQEMRDSEVQSTIAETQATTDESLLDNEDTLDSVIHEPSVAKIGSDAIQYTATENRTQDQDSRDASDLARVAGQLVQNISHETDEKFRNSQFLDLMRRIRDREVEVRNNNFEPAQDAYSTSKTEAPQLQPEDQHSFQFPNMNNVYHPDETIDMTVDDNFTYQPHNQISDLHPGGPFYPEQSPNPRYAQMMSGAVDSSLSTDDAGTDYTRGILQEAETKRWLPWPEAHTADVGQQHVLTSEEMKAAREKSRMSMSSETEAAECWRSAVNLPKPTVAYSSKSFLRMEMERAGVV
ncbi:hypothetical protein LTR05_000852 [Lithohypha guttulata]|uniref:Peroxin 20 n=1 Tax=Lithohypha guttulata TaxID=1690604 RepID=A0AAN7YEC6_9EURO|nr:hypothetical protein LTR05_000852 [Lithohypha guttulata]